MKKIGAVLVLILLLTACVQGGQNQEVNQPPNSVSSSPLEISRGPVCPAYTPQGEVTYSSQWTGEYPEIETYNKAYKTATFGMG